MRQQADVQPVFLQTSDPSHLSTQLHPDRLAHADSFIASLAENPVEGDAHILAIWRVCEIPFIDAVLLEYKEMALRAVAAVTDPALQQVKRRCLAALMHAQVERRMRNRSLRK